MTEEKTEEGTGIRSQMHIHEAMVPWLEAEYGIDMSELSVAEILAYGFAKRNAWRATETYAKVIEDHKAGAAEREAEAAAEKEAAKEAKKAEREAAAEAKATAKAEAAAAKKAEAEKAEKPAKATKAEKAAPAPAKAAKKASKGAKTEEDPFA